MGVFGSDVPPKTAIFFLPGIRRPAAGKDFNRFAAEVRVYDGFPCDSAPGKHDFAAGIISRRIAQTHNHALVAAGFQSFLPIRCGSTIFLDLLTGGDLFKVYLF